MHAPPDLTDQIPSRDEHPVAGGGYSDIYRATMADGRIVSIKVIRINASEKAQKYWTREVQLWIKLDHPHILRLLGTYRMGYRLGLVSLWMKNGSAFEYINNEPNADRRKILRQSGLALEYLHSQGITHGDVKGANILIDHLGNAVLADFGLARLRERIAEFSATATALQHAGSVRFMAPELVQSEELTEEEISEDISRPKVDYVKVDIFAFGRTILELMTGKHPFRECTTEAFVLKKVINGEPPRKPPNFEDDLWSLCLSCWEYEPSARPTMQLILPHLWSVVGSLKKVKSFAWSPCEWDQLAVVHYADPGEELANICHLHNGTIDAQQALNQGNGFTSVQWSRDGTRFICGNLLWERGVKTPRPLDGFPERSGRVLSSWSPSGDRFAGVDTSQHHVGVWDPSTGKLIHYFNLEQSVTDIIWVTENVLVFATLAGSLLVHCIDPTEIWTGELRGHTDMIYRLSLSSDGTRLASSAFDCVRVWDVEQILRSADTTEACLSALNGCGSKMSWCSEPGREHLLATLDSVSQKISIWNTLNGSNVHEITHTKFHKELVQNHAFSPCGRYLAIQSWVGAITFYSSQNWVEIFRIAARPSRNWDSQWNCDGRHFALWDASDKELIIYAMTFP